MESLGIFAWNLCHSDKLIRLSTLRILCHYELLNYEHSPKNEPAENKTRTDVSKSCFADDRGSNVCISFHCCCYILSLLWWVVNLRLIFIKISGSSAPPLNCGCTSFKYYQQERYPNDFKNTDGPLCCKGTWNIFAFCIVWGNWHLLTDLAIYGTQHRSALLSWLAVAGILKWHWIDLFHIWNNVSLIFWHLMINLTEAKLNLLASPVVCAIFSL